MQYNPIFLEMSEGGLEDTEQVEQTFFQTSIN